MIRKFIFILFINPLLLASQTDEYEVHADWEHYISYEQWLIEDSSKNEDVSIYSAENILPESGVFNLGYLGSSAWVEPNREFGFNLGIENHYPFFFNKNNSRYHLR